MTPGHAGHAAALPRRFWGLPPVTGGCQRRPACRRRRRDGGRGMNDPPRTGTYDGAFGRRRRRRWSGSLHGGGSLRFRAVPPETTTRSISPAMDGDGDGKPEAVAPALWTRLADLRGARHICCRAPARSIAEPVASNSIEHVHAGEDLVAHVSRSPRRSQAHEVVRLATRVERPQIRRRSARGVARRW